MRNLFLLLAAAIFFTACNSVPDHARYIPADATIVAGVNLKALGKKIAWSKIVGSDLLDKLEAKAKENGGNSQAVKDLENAGIQVASTVYVYVKNSTATGNRAVAVVPLKDRDEWAAYVKKTFPQAQARTTGERAEARLSSDLYAGWDKDVLLLMNTTNSTYNPYDTDVINDTSFSSPMPADGAGDGKLDDVRLGAEMQMAFAVKKDASIITDKRFKKLEGEGHDLSMFLNYESLMGTMGGGDMGMMTAMYANLYKGTAATAGFDFEKGKITGEALYYTPENMKDAYKGLGNDDVDDALLDRVPAKNLAGLFSWNLSPKSLQAVLEKMGLLGMMNMGLASQGLSFDDITEALAGDMVVAVNNVQVKTVTDTPMYEGEQVGDMYTRKEPEADYLFVMKVGKREKFDKLLAWGVKNQALTAAGTGAYSIGGSTTLMIEKDLAVVARDAAQARAYLDKKLAGGKLPDVARKAVEGHPMGLYMDVQTMLGNLGAAAFDKPKDAAMVAEIKKTFSNFAMHSTGFKGDAFEYEMEMNMTAANENSLVQLIDFAARLKAVDAQYPDPVYDESIAVPDMPTDAYDTSAMVEPTTENVQ